MADVLPMPARQIGHPISVFVLMKTDDLPFHPPSSAKRDITQWILSDKRTFEGTCAGRVRWT